jgi:hypothetical protein
MMMASAWSGGSTFLWTQGYGTMQRSRWVMETLRDVAFGGGLVVLAWGTVFFLGN